MAGVPVYLASLSRRPAGRAEPVSTQVWSKGTMADSIALLRRVLGPAGNPAFERVFRMQVTLCIHRALSDEELDAMPSSFHESEATDLAGGPVEILEQTVDSGPSTKPCHNPTRQRLSGTDPLLWLPVDCTACPPCRARRKLDTRYDEKTARIPRYLDDTLRGVLR